MRAQPIARAIRPKPRPWARSSTMRATASADIGGRRNPRLTVTQDLAVGDGRHRALVVVDRPRRGRHCASRQGGGDPRPAGRTPAEASERGRLPYSSVRNTAIRMAVWTLAMARSAPMMRHAIRASSAPSSVPEVGDIGLRRHLGGRVGRLAHGVNDGVGVPARPGRGHRCSATRRASGSARRGVVDSPGRVVLDPEPAVAGENKPFRQPSRA